MRIEPIRRLCPQPTYTISVSVLINQLVRESPLEFGIPCCDIYHQAPRYNEACDLQFKVLHVLHHTKN